MSWSDTLPGITADVVPSWFESLPSAAGAAPVGWWAGIELDGGTLTVQFLTQAEIIAYTGWELVTHVSVSREAVLQAVQMIAAERGLTVTIDLGLGGTFFLANDAEINVDRLLGLGIVNDMSLGTSMIGVDAEAQTFMRLNYDLAPGVTTVGGATSFALNAAVNFATQWTVDRALTLGQVKGLAAAATVNVNTALGLGFPPNAPLLSQMTTSGNYTIPRWCNYIAMVALGGGGSGQASAALFNVGKGGYGGGYGSGTIERNNHIPWATTTLAVTIGAGGPAAAGPSALPGNSGDNTVISWSGGSVTGAGGSGGFGWGNNDGESPGNLSYDGISAVGGATQTGNAAGNPPGGGGAGSPGFSSSYAGARGQAWFRAYQ